MPLQTLYQRGLGFVGFTKGLPSRRADALFGPLLVDEHHPSDLSDLILRQLDWWFLAVSEGFLDKIPIKLVFVGFTQRLTDVFNPRLSIKD